MLCAIFASGAIPGILPPVRLEDKYLVDGGILNKVPASVLREKGVSNIIAVNVTPQRDLSLTRERDIDSDGLILQTISRSFNLVSMKLSSLNLGAGDFLIKPKVEHYDFFDFKSFDEIIGKGEEAAEKNIAEIKRAFNLI
jgi:NTE family protein